MIVVDNANLDTLIGNAGEATIPIDGVIGGNESMRTALGGTIALTELEAVLSGTANHVTRQWRTAGNEYL